ncbi:S5A-reductase domain-containing protein [Favolaschia claudopus]|uniref:S5A-reductase domain-containing protein n=1 Tax=Favolaschia claudopus TaxID=2862362 RepID=A0AAW0DS08_9AGAR
MSSEKRGGLADVRRTTGFSTPGIATFAIGRLSDAPLQYLLFTQGWAVKGLTAVGLRASNLLVTAGPGIAGLGPIPSLLTGMYALQGLHHAYWVFFTSNYRISPGSGLQVSAFNGTMNTFNTLVAVHALTSSPQPILGSFAECIGWKQYAGLALFALGISIEFIAEQSRKAFKKDLKNKGKIDDTGLWSVVRHPNYLGYALWRIGTTLVTGSLGGTVFMAGIQLASFYGSSIPELSDYMASRYGAQWNDYKRRVPYALVPGIL